MRIGLDRVVEELPAMVWTADPEGRVDSVNRWWSEYVGSSPDDVRGRDCQAAVHPDNGAGRWRLGLQSCQCDG
ncbi:PAS domain-containing protein [Mesorhizobium sp. WSM3862]|uniref:PAS domain-containing protein n=1 Tax=Mesorhizobium sp. WSM3862 TaxID=632858 RepID=UPI000BB08312|nr:PAS domain-containing protein [Mesorhizobium sp. WSM3862]PBB96790.1 hypothetical protein CK224_21195 [Mesorhizobium sp. WSM3862]